MRAGAEKIMDSTLINDIKALVISSLNLEDTTVEDIDENAPLFGEGLGLDSIDALELGLALKKTYGITLTAESAEAREVFRSVKTLADYVAAHRN